MYDEDLDNLDEWLRRLKVEYEVFFNGHRKKPPEDLKMRVEKLIKRLSEVQNMSYAERFRYNTLITRFYVFRDKWRRTLASRELSGELTDQSQAKSMPRAAFPVCVSIADPEAEDEKVRSLYQALVSTGREQAKETATVPYSQFAKYIANKMQTIKNKYGCTKVRFLITIEEEAIRFIASAENPQ